MTAPAATAIDLFCGAGGLSHGLQQAGIPVVAGVDIDASCAYPFEANIEAPFLEQDVRNVTGSQLRRLWARDAARVLAGCAPCQPFSPYRRGVDTTAEEQWPLLGEFGRLVEECLPEVVTMENVPRIGGTRVFTDFVEVLQDCGYRVDWRSCRGPDYGLPQSRRRLVLLASRLGPIRVPEGGWRGRTPRTVRDTIGDLPPLEAGQEDINDPLHKSRALAAINLQRIRASTPGGTWEQWPVELRAPCHRRATGSSFRNVYSRMEWGKPAPTITTLAYSFGTGRFGHPDQDRPISLREAAMLQGFPRSYRFVKRGTAVRFNHLGRLIGNAVPPPIAEAVGHAILRHLAETAPVAGASL